MERDRGNIEPKKIQEFADLRGKEVLEIGCGDGRISRFLAKAAKRLTAIDPDAKAIEKAKLKTADADFRVGSGESLEFGNEAFDIVVFTLSLHHQDAAKAVAEARRVLRKNGQLLIIEPAHDGEVQKLFNLLRSERHDLKNALETIRKSAFFPEREETFFTTWSFADREELYQRYFEHYGAPRDERIIYEINSFLGAKINEKPIILSDKLLIFSLRKK
jgi:ubiquinone/menaquinone biosynthesis C-methylase UbiE